MRVVQVNYAFEAGLRTPDDLLTAYPTLTGWAEALARAGAEVLTVQAFHSSANVTRGGVRYVMGGLRAGMAAARAFGPEVVHVNGLTFPWRTRWVAEASRGGCGGVAEAGRGRCGGVAEARRRHCGDVAAWSREHCGGVAERSREHCGDVADASRGLSGDVAEPEPKQRGEDAAAAPTLIVQDHANLPPSAVRALVWRRLLRPVDAFLFTTPDHAEPWRRAGLIAPHQRVYDVMEASTTLRAVPYDTARQDSDIHGDPALVWIGRLDANKDPLTVLDGFERFAADHERATLTLLFHAGDLLDAVRTRIAASPTLRDRVRLVGAVPHARVATFLSAADVFVVGSRHEGSGYAVMEALACGATPAVTDIPSYRALLGVTDVAEADRRGGSDDSATAPQRPRNAPATSPQRPRTAPPPIGATWTPGDPASCARALAAASALRDRTRVIRHFDTHLTWDAVGRRALAVYRDARRRRTRAAR